MSEAQVANEKRDTVTSFDATELAVRRFGSPGGPPLLVVNAVGSTLAAWRRTLQDVPGSWEIATWDLRGLHESGPALSDRIDAPAHAEDAIAVADHLGIGRFAVASWSSGTPIALTLARLYPERVASLVLVCGGFGYPVARALRHFELGSLLPAAAGIAKHFPTTVGTVLRAVTARPELAGLVRQSGMVGPTADIGTLVALLRGLAECDTQALLAIYEAVAGDGAPEPLSEIAAPTLLIAGGMDQFTPLRLMREMERSIPGARLEVYADATHYLPIEHPERLAADLTVWIERYPA